MQNALIFAFAVAGSVGSIALAAVFLVLPGTVRATLVPLLIAYASGALLGAAFLGLLPEAATDVEMEDVLAVTLAGIFGFFLLEKLLIWRHHHDLGGDHVGSDGPLSPSVGPLVLLGDAFHNLGDGLVIAVTFDVSTGLGVATSLAIVAHEVPQEVGDFAILLESGYSTRRAFAWNTLSSLATLVGAAFGVLFASIVDPVTPWVMALAASSFLYIGMADLIPFLHRHIGASATASQLLCMAAGVGTIAAVRALAS